MILCAKPAPHGAARRWWRRLPTIALIALLAAPISLYGASPNAPVHAPLSLQNPVQDKNFFLLSLCERTPGVSAALQADAELKRIGAARRDALRQAATTCATGVECFTSALRFTEAEISASAAALRHLEQTSEPVREMTDGALRRSGTDVRDAALRSEELLASAWIDAAHGINNILDVYGDGKAPRSAPIDSVSFDVKSQAYLQSITTVAQNLEEQSATLGLFFQPSLRFALSLLQVNHRDEAGRHEPLETKDNAAAVRHLASITWSDFPYTLIVVPGAGSDRLTWSLSSASRLRAEIASRRYRQHKAPLILVSGGYVHPNQTPYSEAIEMKKSLIEDFGVPAEAILVDPHARHTTTNLRNAARLMYRYGIPFERKALITTDSFQITYIEGEPFAQRCRQELGYRPATLLGRVSRFDLEFIPRLESLQIDSMDPLDP